MHNTTTDTTEAEAKAEVDYRIGRQWGWDDGTHPSGVVTHARHRDPEGWAEQSEAWQRGYEVGWGEAR